MNFAFESIQLFIFLLKKFLSLARIWKFARVCLKFHTSLLLSLVPSGVGNFHILNLPNFRLLMHKLLSLGRIRWRRRWREEEEERLREKIRKRWMQTKAFNWQVDLHVACQLCFPAEKNRNVVEVVQLLCFASFLKRKFTRYIKSFMSKPFKITNWKRNQSQTPRVESKYYDSFFSFAYFCMFHWTLHLVSMKIPNNKQSIQSNATSVHFDGELFEIAQ